MALFARQNESFWSPEWPILLRKTARFENQEDFFSNFVGFFYQLKGIRQRRMQK